MTDKPEVGRPLLYDEKLVFLNASITPQQKAWLRMQTGGISVAVRRLLDTAMEEQELQEEAEQVISFTEAERVAMRTLFQQIMAEA